MNLLQTLFSYICGQQHCWVLGGQTLPFCQRCTGLYVGACCAILLVLVFRLRPRAFSYWLHGSFMLFMFPFGFHLIVHGALVRTFTGALFSFGLVYYMALNPVPFWRAWRADSITQTTAYIVLIAAATAALLCSIRLGGALTAFVLTGLGLLGLAGLLLMEIGRAHV